MEKEIIQKSGGLDIVEGFFTRGVHCGIKKSNNDLAIIFSEIPAAAAAVFTTNRVCAAPVELTRINLEKNHHIQLVVVNSGVANACTGTKGMEDAILMSQMAAREFNIEDPSCSMECFFAMKRPASLPLIPQAVIPYWVSMPTKVLFNNPLNTISVRSIAS